MCVPADDVHLGEVVRGSVERDWSAAGCPSEIITQRDRQLETDRKTDRD